ncbi:MULTISPECIES: LysR family transcriptional regulator [unclassified Paenibacillus]|uniref:LysR family transcriptional regulator n=1 Tax=unclassified Paenibacillus TaxID=185978 RepID=UPI002786A483|nr:MULTISPECIES: LysR family transcriptional regulator [unclassified Paenibacillus]MDQ0902106.1 DNA-binding transcriptional LysR family regulator [Paenibacillus sp. V4I7]MDQ0919400.1 DNA-binding transcriptional LysR family regulator [Paenibacillus sp. V4I5]
MNLLGLRYFLKVAKSLNFSLASQELHISQPGLSQQISTLEKEIGLKLFNRTTKKVTLTEEGEYLYKKLSPSFENIEFIVNEISNRKIIPQTIIRISTVPSAASTWLPKLFKTLHSELPEVEIYVQETSSTKAIEDVKQQSSHIAFIRTPIDKKAITDQGLNLIEFTKYPMQAVVSLNHPSAQNESIDLYELRNDPFFHYDKEQAPSLHFLLEKACLTAGFQPKTLCVGSEILTIENLIADDLGVTLMPSDMVNLLKSNRVKSLNLKEILLNSSISVIWRDSNYVPLTTQHTLNIIKASMLSK